MANQEEKKKPAVGRVPIIVVAGFIVVLGVLAKYSLLFNLDCKAADAMFIARGPELGDERVAIVAIDDASLAYAGAYPWPRGRYVELLTALFDKYGARLVGMDVMYFEKSVDAEDRKFVALTRKYADRLVHATSVDERAWLERGVFEPREPFPALKAVTKHLGNVNQLLIDSDGMVRRTLVLIGTDASAPESDYLHDPKAVPSLGLKLLSLYEGKPHLSYLQERGPNVVLNTRGEVKKPRGHTRDEKTGKTTAVAEEATLPFIRTISAASVMRQRLNDQEKAAIKDHVVLIGSTARGAFDHYPSPFSSGAPGVEIHATVVDNLLNNRDLRYAPLYVTLVFIVLFAAAGAALVLLQPLVASIGFIFLLLAWMAVVFAAFLNLYVMEFSGPALALIGPFAVLMVRKTLQEGREKRFIKQTFGQYVAPEVVDILVKDPSKIRLGGEKRDMTIFFLDIAHFTTISEKMEPERLILFLNHYLTELTDVILRNHGVVDKYIGDCIMAFWNAPLDLADHRRFGCLSAVECIQAIEKLNNEYADPTIPERPAIRIGLNSGTVVVGNTGSARKLAYTVLGDEVNLASRLEGANKFFGSHLMVSEACYSGAGGAVVGRELGRIRVVGKDIPIKVFELLAKKGALPEAWENAHPVYHEGLARYHEREFEKAGEAFAEVMKLVPSDPPSKLYMNLCEDYAQIPPPPEWDGVFNLTAK